MEEYDRDKWFLDNYNRHLFIQHGYVGEFIDRFFADTSWHDDLRKHMLDVHSNMFKVFERAKNNGRISVQGINRYYHALYLYMEAFAESEEFPQAASTAHEYWQWLQENKEHIEGIIAEANDVRNQIFSTLAGNVSYVEELPEYISL